MEGAADQPGLDQLRQEFERERLPSHVRTAAGVGFVINAGFAVLDAFAYPDQLPLFFGLRVALGLLCIGVWSYAVHRAPKASQYVLSLGFGAAMLAMIYATGGPASEYFIGLLLVLVAMGVLLPLGVAGAVAICTAFVVPYALSGLIVDHPFSIREFGIRLVFVVSGAVECIWSCAFLESLRLQDFRQRREIEQARDHLREMDRVKSRFTANIHHELRTPLTLMLAPLDSLLGGDLGALPDPVQAYLRTMRSNGLRLLKLINNLLDLAKLESRELSVTRRPLALGERIGEVVASARPMVERKQIALSHELAEGLPEIHADADALDKVLVNLLGNALKFTPAGGTIRFRAFPEAGGVHVVVEDSGIGIPPDQLGRIFDRFAQVDGSATRRFEGTGIGLSLCQELVELHGGRIWAESEGQGHGTRMHFTLPPGEPDAAGPEPMLEAASGASARASAGDSLQGAVDGIAAEVDLGASEGDARLEEMERHVDRHEDWQHNRAATRREGRTEAERPAVVLAEDNPDMRRLLADLLGREFRVRATAHGRAALEAVREEPPELVVTDVMMPEMSGTELCQAIKQDPELSGVSVMLVTSKAERELKIQGLELGADDYVTKPFHPRELLARARSLARLRLLGRALEERNAALESALVELRETQAQLVHREKMASLGQFVAGIAHELNNPLNFLQGGVYHLRRYTDAMLEALGHYEEQLGQLGQVEAVDAVHAEGKLDHVLSDLQSVIDTCDEGVERCTALVNDLRTFSRLDRAELAPTRLEEGLDSTLRLLAARLRRIEVVRDYEALPPVECVGGHVNQIFMNLLANAADATGEGGRIEVRTRCLGDDRVVVEVADDGPGLDPEVAGRVFEPFFTTKPVGAGTGLGLSVSYGIAARHGGSLSVQSRPGEGCRFRLELPVRPADENVAAVTPSASELPVGKP